jgi:hypothetical protein
MKFRVKTDSWPNILDFGKRDFDATNPGWPGLFWMPGGMV